MLQRLQDTLWQLIDSLRGMVIRVQTSSIVLLLENEGSLLKNIFVKVRKSLWLGAFRLALILTRMVRKFTRQMLLWMNMNLWKAKLLVKIMVAEVHR